MIPVDFKIYFKHKHRDTYRSVEILSEAGNAEAPRQVGRVVNVFHDGFYELELLAEIDSSQPDGGMSPSSRIGSLLTRTLHWRTVGSDSQMSKNRPEGRPLV